VDGIYHMVPPDAVWTDPWSVTERLFLTVRDEVVARGSSFWIVTLTNGIQVTPERDTRKRFMDRMRIGNIDYPDERIAQCARAHGIPIITLVKTLRAYAENSGLFLHGFGDGRGSGHWNEDGHRVAGQEIANRLCREIPNSQEPAKVR
jgi:hypothetical protein